MAHEITQRADGMNEMAFVGNRSEIWHGLGQSLTPGSSIETWQKEAGMDWNINSSRLLYEDQSANDRVFAGKQVLYRSDSLDALSVVGDTYKPVQPKEVLEFFRSLVGDVGMELSTAGTLFGGRKFWALADTKQAVNLNGGDKIGGFLLLSTSCDGTLATTAQFTSVRVVCNNTLNVALGDGARQRVSTTHRSVFKPNEVKGKLGLYESAWDKFSKQMVAMQATKVSAKDAYDDIMMLMAHDPTEPTNAEVRTVNAIHSLYLGGGMGSDLAGKTAYGVLNAVTEYWDHHVGRNPNRQLDSTFWGPGSKNKTAAFDYLVNEYEIEVV
jgi:phage/plasmid-like protein (TIGR03299 family)